MARSRPSEQVELDDVDRAIINRLQEAIPLTPEPFKVIGNELGIAADDLLQRTNRLRDTGVLTRFGPFFDAAAMGGAFCLCAIAVPEDSFDEVTAVVNAFPEVAHNYAREHVLNMWFVLATEKPAGIEETARRIEAATGLDVLCFPKLEEYFVGFRVAA